VTDLLSGQIQATFAIAPAVLPQMKAGKLKGLAVTSAKRSALAPEIPTVAEQGFPQFDATAWIGLLAPAGTPAGIVERLGAEAQRILRLPEVREALTKHGFDVIGSTPGEFARFIRAESEKWGAVVRAVGAKPE
jgi:tripartite-type tricarboxylate transporter receptor subunit TctC